jgi:hypothetical protein
MFPAGKKDQSDVQEYDGGRTASDIVSWVNDKYTANIPPPEVYQVNNTVNNSFKIISEQFIEITLLTIHLKLSVNNSLKIISKQFIENYQLTIH